MRFKLAVMTLVLSLMLIGSLSPAMAKISKKDMAAIKANTEAWAAAATAGEWDKVAMLYAEDAVLMPPGEPAIKGRQGIKEHFAHFPKFTDLKLDVVEIEGNGDLAYVWGSYSMTVTGEGPNPMKVVGKYLEIQRKQKDGSWLVVRDIYSPDTHLH